MRFSQDTRFRVTTTRRRRENGAAQRHQQNRAWFPAGHHDCYRTAVLFPTVPFVRNSRHRHTGGCHSRADSSHRSHAMTQTTIPRNFSELAASRRAWIDEVLKPWCRQAPRAELLRAELEWNDIAGRVDPQATLWTWAWSRFPDLVSEGLPGVDETYEVEVTLRDGRRFVGFPNARESTAGRLVLMTRPPQPGSEPTQCGPFSIDEIAAVRRRATGAER